MRRSAALILGLAGLLLFVAAFEQGAGELTPARLGLSALLSSSGLACFAVAAALLTHHGLAESLALGRPRLAAPAVAILAAGTVGVSHLAELAVETAGLTSGSVLELLDTSLRGARGSGLVLALLGVGIAPAFGEELLFRGVLLRSATLRFGPVAALIATSLLFGLAHGDLAQGSAAILLGAYLGAIAWVSKSVWPAVISHAANNVCGVLLAGVEGGPTAFALALVAAVSGLAVLLRKR